MMIKLVLISLQSSNLTLLMSFNFQLRGALPFFFKQDLNKCCFLVLMKGPSI